MKILIIFINITCPVKALFTFFYEIFCSETDTLKEIIPAPPLLIRHVLEGEIRQNEFVSILYKVTSITVHKLGRYTLRCK